MNKTIFNLNKELSIIILSGLSILFAFLSNYESVNGIISFLFIILKSIVFIVIPLTIYIIEKNNLDFKKVAGIYTGYFLIEFFIVVISFPMLDSFIPHISKFLFDLVNLTVLLTSMFILIEQILECYGIKSKVYTFSIMKIVYLVGNFIAYPLISLIDKKNKEDLDE